MAHPARIINWAGAQNPQYGLSGAAAVLRRFVGLTLSRLTVSPDCQQLTLVPDRQVHTYSVGAWTVRWHRPCHPFPAGWIVVGSVT